MHLNHCGNAVMLFLSYKNFYILTTLNDDNLYKVLALNLSSRLQSRS